MTDKLYEQILQELEAGKGDIPPSSVVMFSEPLRSALNFALSAKRFTLTEFTGQLKFTRGQAKRIAELLIERHLLNLLPRPGKEETYYEISSSK